MELEEEEEEEEKKVEEEQDDEVSRQAWEEAERLKQEILES